MIDKKQILIELRAYRDNMSEFDEEEMDYLIQLVEMDLELRTYLVSFAHTLTFVYYVRKFILILPSLRAGIVLLPISCNTKTVSNG